MRHTIRLFLPVLLLCPCMCDAHQVTIFWSPGGGGFGYQMRRPWFVDGREFVQIKGNERVTIELSAGTHTIRDRPVGTSRVFSVQAPTVIMYSEGGFVEARPDLDPAVKAELDEMTSVKPNPSFSPADSLKN